MTPALDSATMTTGPKHPLWDRQVRLEYEMLSLGADAVRESVEKAREKHHLSTTNPSRKLLKDWLPGVANEIRDWRRAALRAKRTQPVILRYILGADPVLLALVGIREILDAIGTDRPKVTRIAHGIGRWSEHELKMRFWEKHDPEGFKAAQFYFAREHSTEVHRLRGNVILANRSVSDLWEKWPDEVQLRVGFMVIEATMRATQLFNTVFDDPEGRGIGITKSKRNLPIILQAKPELIGWLQNAYNLEEATKPRFAPTIIPPKEWTDTKDGGYWTPYVPSPRFIGFKAHHRLHQRNAEQEYDSLEMPDIYRAVNIVQSVPWRVNRRVLEIAEKCWAMDLQIASLPALSKEPDPPKPEDMDTNPEAEREWRRQARGVRRRNNSIAGRMKSTHKIVTMAQEYSQEDRFYFPHMLDFRGRMYSIPSGLSPQGTDLAKGLLQFADSKPILEVNGGARWLALQVANMMDRDKLPNDERLAYVQDRREDWLAVARDPIGQRSVWADSGNPWQALAAILDWEGYLREGEGYRSSLAVTVDGTCNGLQHLTALIRDHRAAPLVNLLPSDKPHDIYLSVAVDLQDALAPIILKGGDGGEKAEWFMGIWGDRIPRSATKRPVMVVPYGGTRDAFFKYVKEAVEEKIGRIDGDDRAFKNSAIGLATKLLWAVCEKRLPGAMGLMKWLQACSKVCAEANQPIYWTVPSKFVVRHFYNKQVSGQLAVKLNGKTVYVRVERPTRDLDAMRQTRGVAPNFIHSLDAAALALTFNKCEAVGITHITGIHDAYGTHAADMSRLAVLLRDAFVQVHEEDPLETFWEACRDVLVQLYILRGADPDKALKAAEKKKPRKPRVGKLDIREVLKSDYFFS